VEHPDFAEGREAFLRKRRARFGQSRRNA
jgi:hypothetical protein